MGVADAAGMGAARVAARRSAAAAEARAGGVAAAAGQVAGGVAAAAPPAAAAAADAAAVVARPLPLVFGHMGGQQRLRLFTDASIVRLGAPTAHTGFVIFATPGSVPAGRLAPDSPLALLRIRLP